VNLSTTIITTLTTISIIHLTTLAPVGVVRATTFTPIDTDILYMITAFIV
jgi:hypothetical protein